MWNSIIVLNQIANTVTLYANCYKNGYTRLCYFSDPEDIAIIDLSGPEITIRSLEEKEYYFYCVDQDLNETGHIKISVDAVSYKNFMDNIVEFTQTDDIDLIIPKINEQNYVMDLYRRATSRKKNFSYYEKLIMACVSFYNIRHEVLNSDTTPEFNLVFCPLKINSTNYKKYNYIPYVYDLDTKTWKRLSYQEEFRTESFAFSGKPSLMYRIRVLSDFNLVREYFYYQPSETLSKTILEGNISSQQQLTEKTAEMLTKLDVTEILDDEYAQEVVLALQEITPAFPIFRAPTISYNGYTGTISAKIENYLWILASRNKIYLAALELDQAFAKNKAPHKIPVHSSNMIFDPSIYLMNYGEDYIFYICDAAGNILSAPAIAAYGTNNNLSDIVQAKRRTDLELYRRRLFNIFKEYDKNSWDKIALILDQYMIAREDYYEPFLTYMIRKISYLDLYKDHSDFLLQLILLAWVQHYMPTDRTFLSHQVYGEAYHKHVLPEQENPYIICCMRINHGEITWNFLTGGEIAQEIWTDRDDYLLLFAMSPDFSRMSPSAFYSNIHQGQTRYFYYPGLEVDITHGLY